MRHRATCLPHSSRTAPSGSPRCATPSSGWYGAHRSGTTTSPGSRRALAARLGAGHVVDVPYVFNTLASKQATPFLGGPETRRWPMRCTATGRGSSGPGDAGWPRYELDTTTHHALRHPVGRGRRPLTRATSALVRCRIQVNRNPIRIRCSALSRQENTMNGKIVGAASGVAPPGPDAMRGVPRACKARVRTRT